MAGQTARRRTSTSASSLPRRTEAHPERLRLRGRGLRAGRSPIARGDTSRGTYRQRAVWRRVGADQWRLHRVQSQRCGPRIDRRLRHGRDGDLPRQWTSRDHNGGQRLSRRPVARPGTTPPPASQHLIRVEQSNADFALHFQRTRADIRDVHRAIDDFGGTLAGSKPATGGPSRRCSLGSGRRSPATCERGESTTPTTSLMRYFRAVSKHSDIPRRRRSVSLVDVHDRPQRVARRSASGPAPPSTTEMDAADVLRQRDIADDIIDSLDRDRIERVIEQLPRTRATSSCSASSATCRSRKRPRSSTRATRRSRRSSAGAPWRSFGDFRQRAYRNERRWRLRR